MVWWESKQCPQFPSLLSDQIPIEQVTKNDILMQAGDMSQNFSHAFSLCFLHLVYCIRAHKIIVPQKDICKMLSIYFKD